MKLWKFVFIFIVLCDVAGLYGNTPPVVGNVNASQRTDGSKIVDIWYNVSDADNDTLSISMQVSNDNGITFGINPSPANLSGAIGNGILSGSNKHIVWNAGAEAISYDSNQFKVKVVANDINLSEGLVAYYPFNGNANDESGNNHHAIMTGASYTQNRFGQANLASSHSFGSGLSNNLLISGEKTLILWLKTNRLPSTMDGFGIGFIAPYPTSWAPNGSCFGFYYGLGLNHDFAFQGWWIAYSIHSYDYMWSNDSMWHMIAVIMDEEFQCKWYIDGVRQMQLYENLTGLIVNEFSLMSSLFPFNIHWSSAEGIPDYIVNIDDIRIYDRPLSNDEIQALYHEGGWEGNP